MLKDFNKLNPYVKLAIAVVLIIIIYIAVKRISIWVKTKNANFQLNQESNVFASQGQQLSYQPSQYKTYADNLKNAYGWFNDDEDAIYSVFRAMNNDLDILELEKQFRARQGESIADFLASVFNRSEIDEVNAILQANNIVRNY